MMCHYFAISAAFLMATVTLPVKADSEAFGLMTLRSASALQYAELLIQDEDDNGYYPISVGRVENDTWQYVIDDLGQLVANESYYWTIIPDSDGRYALTLNSSEAIEGFYIDSGMLSTTDEYLFIAVPDGLSWDLYSQNATGKNGNSVYNLGLGLLAYNSEGFASNYTPENFVNTTTVSSTSSVAQSASVSSGTLQSASSSTETDLSTQISTQNGGSSTQYSATSAATTSSQSSTKTASNSTVTRSSSAAATKKNAGAQLSNRVGMLAIGLAGIFL